MAMSFLERALKAQGNQQGGEGLPPSAMPLGGRRSEAVHRLQIGLSGIAAMVLLVALADVILTRADQSEASAVPEAVATVEPVASEVPRNDPLAEAGVIPDLPASPTPTTTAAPTSPPTEREASGGQ